jgi:hypothetical protein
MDQRCKRALDCPDYSVGPVGYWRLLPLPSRDEVRTFYPTPLSRCSSATVYSYLADCYPRHVASVLASNDLFRSFVGASFPLYSTGQ